MQAVLFAIASASKKEGEEAKDESEVQRFEENIKSYGILLAHISGFAAINAWGTLQQNVVHHIGIRTVWVQQVAAGLVVVFSGLAMALVLKITSKARKRLYLVGDGAVDEW